MASVFCSSSDFRYRFYNGGWSNWSSNMHGGFAGTSRCVIFKFYVPGYPGEAIYGNKITIDVPYVRNAGHSTEGRLYANLYTSDPSSRAIPSANNCEDSAPWNTNDKQIHTARFIIEKSIAAGTWHYLHIGASNTIEVGHDNDTAKDIWSVEVDYTYYTKGTVGKPTISQTTGTNTFKLSCSYTAGENNALESGKIYYTTDGKTPTTSSSYVAISGGTVNVSANCTVKAWARCTFAHGDTATSDVASKSVYYYTLGTAPSCTIKDNGNNTFTISGTLGSNGHNNKLSGATLYYTTNGRMPSGGESWTHAVSLTSSGSGGSYSKTYDIPAGCTKIIAITYCAFALNTEHSGNQTGAVAYHTAIGSPSIKIVDNCNNTFTITGTDASNGTNNTATTTYVWGYSTNYGSSGTGTKNLTIATPANATRTVYAKATATPSWSGDSSKNDSASLAIKQYVAPGDPGKPAISYTRNRLTLKENWTYSWTAANGMNKYSAVKGYRLRLYKNRVNIPIFVDGVRKSVLNGSSTTDYIYDTDSTSTSITIDPVKHEFKPGDTVMLSIYAYSLRGDGVKLWNGGGTAAAGQDSEETTVQNAGVVNVKVGGAWKEGQVWVKVSGAWKEAETVSVKTSSGWKESQ